jgi:AraC-like DNA-binding protein
MSFYFEKIPLLSNSTYIIRSFEVPYIEFPIHIHPEYELNFIEKGSGFRSVGDNIAPFTNGDLVLTGPNLPHQWKSEIEPNGQLYKQIVLQIHPHFLGAEFMERSEALLVKKLLENASRGILFESPVVKKASEKLIQLQKKDGFEGLLIFLELIYLLANTSNFRLLSTKTFVSDLDKKPYYDRINPVYNFLLEHFKENININEVAAQMNMSTSALSHFIKKKTAKSFTELLAELRIGFACKQLIETNYTIAQISDNCGFNNLSYFNRRFKELKKCSPLEFRKLFDK